MSFIVNVLVSALIIGVASWLSGRFPIMAGFMVALPLTTMVVLPLSYVQYGDTGNTILLAKSIFVAIPITLTFFIPFLAAERLGLSFWPAYGFACLALGLGFVVHQVITKLI